MGEAERMEETGHDDEFYSQNVSHYNTLNFASPVNNGADFVKQMESFRS